MQLNELLSPSRTLSQVHIDNKKRAFELISKIAAQEVTDTTPQSVFAALVERERLGSTSLGNGIAMPHARIQHIAQPMAILLNLTEPIDYDDQGHQPITIIIALLLPTEHDKQCLDCMAYITKAFRRRSFRQRISKAHTNEELYTLAIANANHEK